MKSENQKNETSLSKQRKLQKQQEIQKQKRNRVLGRLVLVVVCLAIVGLVAWAVASSISKKNKNVEMNADFSAQLEENGMIKGVKAGDYVTLCDYENLTVPKSEVEYTDDQLTDDLTSILEQYKAANTETTAAVEDGDKVVIDYSGSMDGVVFEGGTAEDADLEIGSGSFIDDFEEQIIGHVVGDSFDVNVTFPDPYENNPDYAGKDAVFAVTLKAIYTLPELNDEFVQTNFAEYASTADEFTAYVRKSNSDSKLYDYIDKYLTDNSQVKSVPKDFLKQLKATYKYNEYANNFQYMNDLYYSTLGYYAYTDFADYISKTYAQTEEEYDASLEENVKSSADYFLICQAIAEKMGISMTKEEALQMYKDNHGTEENFNSQLAVYGTGYVCQSALDSKVVKALAEKAVIQ